MLIKYDNFEIKVCFGLMKNCPICNKEMESDPIVTRCLNGCWEDYNDYVIIFGEYISFWDERTIEKISNKLKYWKENDRYLSKILGV